MLLVKKEKRVGERRYKKRERAGERSGMNKLMRKEIGSDRKYTTGDWSVGDDQGEGQSGVFLSLVGGGVCGVSL